MTTDTPTAPPTEPAAAHGRPAPPAPTADPLHVLLYFLSAVGGDYRVKISDANARAIFDAMKAEAKSPSLNVSDLALAAGAASLVASSLRSLAWRLRGNQGELPAEPRKGKKRPIYVRKNETPAEAAARYDEPAKADADGGAVVRRRPGETQDEARARTIKEAFGIEVPPAARR
jgi:hypothetical protein